MKRPLSEIWWRLEVEVTSLLAAFFRLFFVIAISGSTLFGCGPLPEINDFRRTAQLEPSIASAFPWVEQPRLRPLTSGNEYSEPAGGSATDETDDDEVYLWGFDTELGSERFKVLRSSEEPPAKVVLLWATTSKGGLGRVFRSSDGVPLEGVEVTVESATVTKSKSDAQGVIRVGAKLEHRTHKIIVQYEGRTLTALFATPVDPVELTAEIWTDRPAYRHGDLARVHLLARRSVGVTGHLVPPPEGTPVSCQITSYGASHSRRIEGTLSEAGFASLTIPISNRRQRTEAAVVCRVGETDIDGPYVSLTAEPRLWAPRVEVEATMMNTVGADEIIIEARVTPDMPVALNLWNLQSVTQGSREPHLEWAKRLSPPLEGQLFFGEVAPWVHVMLANVAMSATPNQRRETSYLRGPSGTFIVGDGLNRSPFDEHGNVKVITELQGDGFNWPHEYHHRVSVPTSAGTAIFRSADSLYTKHPVIVLQQTPRFFPVGKSITVRGLLVDREGSPLSGKTLGLHLRHWQRELRWFEGDDAESWYVHHELHRDEGCRFETSEAPFECELTPDQPGRYLLVGSSRALGEDMSLTYTTVDVYGDGPAPMYGESKNGRGPLLERYPMELIPEHASYCVGEEMNILIRAPFPHSEGMLWIEGRGLVGSKLLSLDSGSSVLTLPVDDVGTSQLCLRAAVVGSLIDGERIARSLVSGYAGFRDESKRARMLEGLRPFRELRNAEGRVCITVEPSDPIMVDISSTPSVGLPGEVVDLEVRTRDREGSPIPAELIVESSRASTWDQFNQHPGPSLSQLRSTIAAGTHYGAAVRAETPTTGADLVLEPLGVYSGRWVGCSGREYIGARTAFVRLDETPFTIGLETDEQGRATARLHLPFGTEALQVVVTAADRQGRVGIGQTEIELSSTLELHAELPPIVSINDVVDIEVEVRNRSTTTSTASLAFRASGLELVGEELESVTIAPRSTRRVIFSLRAVGSEGLAEIQLFALSESGRAWTEELIIIDGQRCVARSELSRGWEMPAPRFIDVESGAPIEPDEIGRYHLSYQQRVIVALELPPEVNSDDFDELRAPRPPLLRAYGSEYWFGDARDQSNESHHTYRGDSVFHSARGLEVALSSIHGADTISFHAIAIRRGVACLPGVALRRNGDSEDNGEWLRGEPTMIIVE